MKRIVWPLILTLLLAIALSACGGGGTAEPAAPAADTAQEAPADTSAPAEEAAQPTEAPAEQAAPDEPADAAAPTEAPAEAPADAPAAEGVAGLAASGIDADTGLEINPPEIQPGTDYIIRGELVNYALIPTDKPEFMVESPDGSRFRIQSQPLDQISYADGTQIEPHMYKRGMLVQATARLMESDTATSVMLSTDFTLLPSGE